MHGKVRECLVKRDRDLMLGWAGIGCQIDLWGASIFIDVLQIDKASKLSIMGCCCWLPKVLGLAEVNRNRWHCGSSGREFGAVVNAKKYEKKKRPEKLGKFPYLVCGTTV